MEAQTRKEWLEERVIPNLIVAMIASFWIAMFASALGFGVGLLATTFQKSIGVAIVDFFVVFPISSAWLARRFWKYVLKDAETKTFREE